MSMRERAEGRRVRKNAEKDLQSAGENVRKAVDLKDPKFLGEAAMALRGGPLGLAVFGTRKGLALVKEHRGESAATLKKFARQEAKDAAKDRKEAEKALARSRRGPLRRFAPLWVTGLLGGAAVAGATAYFLRDDTPVTPAPTPRPNDVKPGVGDPEDAGVGTAGTPASDATSGSATPTGTAAGTTDATGRHALEDPTGSDIPAPLLSRGLEESSGADVTVDTPDPDDTPDHKKK